MMLKESTRTSLAGSSAGINRILSVSACLVFIATILSYAGLIGLGRWALDEYFYLYWMRKMHVLPLLFQRLKWSPRPISEMLLFAYGRAVNYLHQPLMVPFLAGLWAVLISAGLLTFWQQRREHKREESGPQLLIALCLLALFLSGGHTTEVFFWPAGAVAYLPTLAASLLLFLQTIDGRLDTVRSRLIASICLFVAAGTSEAGAMFVMSYGFILAFHRIRSIVLSRERATGKPFWWWVTPTAVATLLMLIVLTNRFETREMSTGQSIAGRPIASLRASFQEVVVELVGREMLANTMRSHPNPHLWLHSGPRLPIEMLLGSRLWMEILLAAGMALCWSQFGAVSRRTAVQILEVVAAFALASLFTIVAANLHFGTTCCGRHELLRECWMEMIIAGLVVASTAWTSEEHLRRRRAYKNLGPLLLVAAVLSLGHIGSVLETYKLYGTLRTAREQNFESGFRQGDKQMEFSVLPSLGIISEEPLTPGTYIAAPVKTTDFGIDFYPYYVLAFFDKQELVIHPLRIGVTGAESRSGVAPVSDCELIFARGAQAAEASQSCKVALR